MRCCEPALVASVAPRGRVAEIVRPHYPSRMFGALKRLFSTPAGHEMSDGSLVFTPHGKPSDTSDPLGEAALRSEATAEFILLLSERGVHIIGKHLERMAVRRSPTLLTLPGSFGCFLHRSVRRSLCRLSPLLR